MMLGTLEFWEISSGLSFSDAHLWVTVLHPNVYAGFVNF
jgi:hypothetical protein